MPIFWNKLVIKTSHQKPSENEGGIKSSTHNTATLNLITDATIKNNFDF